MPEIWQIIISSLLIVAGTLGAVLPFLPGLPLAWIGLLLYAWAHHFPTSMIVGLIVFAVMIALTVVVDVFAPALAAYGHKASKTGLAGAIIGGIFGVIVLGPIGILIGPFVGAFIGELAHAGNSQHAIRVAFASRLGLIIGTAFKLLVGISMLVYFIIMVA